MLRFITGLATGLLISYLTAPRPGSDTRRQLTDFIDDEFEGYRLLKVQWDRTLAQLNKLVGNVKAESALFAGEANTAYRRTPIKNSHDTVIGHVADSAKTGVD